MRHRISITAIIGILIILACAGGAVLAPWIAPYDPNLPLGGRWENGTVVVQVKAGQATTIPPLKQLP